MQNTIKNNYSSIHTNVDFLAFVERSKLNDWDIFILFHNLQKFIYSHNFSKKEVFEIFDFFKFDRIDAIDIYIKKCFYSTRYKAGNFKKFKNSFTIFMIIFDHLYAKDIIDFHYTLNNDSSIKEYYSFIDKVEIYRGWSDLQFIELIGLMFSMDLLYHLTVRKKFFVKVGVYSTEVKELLIKIITTKNIIRDDSIKDFDILLKELMFIANISLMHIFEILRADIIFIVQLDANLQGTLLQSPINAEYSKNNPDANNTEIEKAAKAFYDDFMEDYDLYLKDFHNYSQKNTSSNDNIKVKLKDRIKNALSKIFSYDTEVKDKYSENKEHTLSIDSQSKERIFIIYYPFLDNAKLDFFNLIISQYNKRIFANKLKFHEIVKEQKDYVNPNPSKYDKYLEDDAEGYIIFDLTKEENKELINKLMEDNKSFIDNCEKKIIALKKECLDDVIEFVIFDSFSYVKFFFNFLKDHDLTIEEICLLFNSKKYNNKKHKG